MAEKVVGGLKWVKGEIAATLKRVRDRVEAYGASGDTARLNEAADALFEVRGVLLALQLPQPARLVEEMQRLTDAMLEARVRSPGEAAEAMMLALIQLPNHLDRLDAGAEVPPLALWPTINDLRESRGAPPVSQAELLVPASVLADSAEDEVPAEALEALGAIFRKVRPHFHRHLVEWYRPDTREEGLTKLVRLFHQLHRYLKDGVLADLFRLAETHAGALQGGQIAQGPNHQSLVGHLDQVLKPLATIPPQWPQDAAFGLIDDYLTALANAGISSGLIAELLAQYGQNAAPQEVAPAATEAVAGLAAAVLDELAGVKEQLDLFVRGERDDRTPLDAMRATLRTLAQTLDVADTGRLPQRLRGLADGFGELAMADSGEDVLRLEPLASELLSIEGVLRAYAEHRPPPASQELGPGILANELSVATLREARGELARVKEAVQACQGPGGRPEVFRAVPGHLEGISGALQILGDDAPAGLAEDIGGLVQRHYVEPGRWPRGEELTHLAQAIAALELFIERLEEDEPAEDRLFDEADTALRTLEALLRDGSVDSALAEPLGMSRVEPIPAPVLPVGLPTMSPELVEVFLEEAGDETRTIDDHLGRWQADSSDDLALTTLRRSFHTLKGSGRLVGATRVGDLCDAIESLLNRIIEHRLSAAPEVVELVGEASALLPALIQAEAERQPLDVRPLIERAAAFESGGVDSLALPSPTAEEDLLVPEIQGLPELPELALADPARAAGTAALGAEPAFSDPAGPTSEPLDDFLVESADAWLQASAELGTSTADLDAVPAAPAPAPGHGGLLVTDHASLFAADDELLGIFRGESREHLQVVENYLSAAGSHQAVPDEAVVRALHTLTGSARMSGVDSIAEVTKPLELALREHQRSDTAPATELVDDLRRAADAIAARIDELPEVGAGAAALVELARRMRGEPRAEQGPVESVSMLLDEGELPEALGRLDADGYVRAAGETRPEDGIGLLPLADSDLDALFAAGEGADSGGEAVLDAADHLLDLDADLRSPRGREGDAGLPDLGIMDLEAELERALAADADAPVPPAERIGEQPSGTPRAGLGDAESADIVGLDLVALGDLESSIESVLAEPASEDAPRSLDAQSPWAESLGDVPERALESPGRPDRPAAGDLPVSLDAEPLEWVDDGVPALGLEPPGGAEPVEVTALVTPAPSDAPPEAFTLDEPRRGGEQPSQHAGVESLAGDALLSRDVEPLELPVGAQPVGDAELPAAAEASELVDAIDLGAADAPVAWDAAPLEPPLLEARVPGLEPQGTPAQQDLGPVSDTAPLDLAELAEAPAEGDAPTVSLGAEPWAPAGEIASALDIDDAPLALDGPQIPAQAAAQGAGEAASDLPLGAGPGSVPPAVPEYPQAIETAALLAAPGDPAAEASRAGLQDSVEAVEAPAPKPEPEPEFEPEPEPEPEFEPEPEPEPEFEPEPQFEPELKSEPEPEPRSEPETAYALTLEGTPPEAETSALGPSAAEAPLQTPEQALASEPAMPGETDAALQASSPGQAPLPAARPATAPARAEAPAVAAARAGDADVDPPPEDPELGTLFLEDARDLLDGIDARIREWQFAPQDLAPLEGINRMLHTLKGSARLTGLPAIGNLSHALETRLTAVNGAAAGVDDLTLELTQKAVDALAVQVDALEQGQPIPRASSLVDALNQPPEPAAPVSTESPDLAVMRPAEPKTSAGEHAATFASLVAEREGPAPTGTPQIRVRADLLNRLVDNSGEIGLYRARLAQRNGLLGFGLGELDQTVIRLREQLRLLEIETETQILHRFEREGGQGDDGAGFDPLELDRFSSLQQLSRALAETVNDLVSLKELLGGYQRESADLLTQQARLADDLQDRLLRTRMVPFVQVVPRLHRLVRQTADNLGKAARLEVVGPEVELDRSILDRLVAPLEHLLRNAVDHGLEAPEGRRAAGKPETGVITLALSREGNDVLIDLSDDGRGLNVPAIRSQAIARGLLSPQAQLADSALIQFVFEAGFTTVDRVTQISGRGVGLDVVGSEIKAANGSIALDSTPGTGTRFSIRLPLTLAIIEAFLIAVGENIYAVPHTTIRGAARISREDLAAVYRGKGRDFEYRGERYRVVYLGGVLDHRQEPDLGERRWLPLLLARSGEQRVAFHVDNLIESARIVIKPLGPQLAGVRWLSGGTILPDGQVALILDALALLRSGAVQDYLPTEAASLGAGHEAPVCVMVVDDSLTVRRVTSRLLRRQNMEVLTAKDGVEALTLLDERRPDLMLLDIEMPRMDGYELTRHVRRSDRLRDLPIIMITSRTGEKHRDLAFSLGVDRYLGKPYQESELLDEISAVLTEQGR